MTNKATLKTTTKFLETTLKIHQEEEENLLNFLLNKSWIE